MSIRKINTMISTIRSIYDENGNYLPAGNYYYEINNHDNDIFIGNITNSHGSFGIFRFTSLDLVKMMAVSQSKLLSNSNTTYENGMPNYPVPLNNPSPNLYTERISRNDFRNNNRNNTIKNITIRNNTLRNNTVSNDSIRSRYVVEAYGSTNRIVKRNENTRVNIPRTQNEVYDCTICMEKIDSTDKKILTCNHKFHTNCINKWLLENNTCPICRTTQYTNLNSSSISSTNIRSRISFLRGDRFYNAVDELQRSYRENRVIFRHK